MFRLEKKEMGITLLAVILTIVIMLVLAAVTIGAINGGLFDYARDAKKSTEELSLQEELQRAIVDANGKSKTGEVTAEDLQKELDKIFGEDVANVDTDGSNIIIAMEGRYFTLDSKGNLGESTNIEPAEYAGTIGKNGKYTGTSANPYRIECIEDLVAFSKSVNSGTTYSGKYIKLDNDLDFNSVDSYSNFRTKYYYDSTNKAYKVDTDGTSTTTIKELCTTGMGFIPIGLDSTKSFRGTFDGNGKTISNLYIKRSSVAAFFLYVSGAKINNLTIEGNVIVTGSSAGGMVYSGSVTMTKCYNKANVTAANRACGLHNTGSGTYTNCGNEGNIVANTTGEGLAIGLAGTAGPFNKCYNKGNVTAKYSQAMGLCKDSGTATNCYNTGNISSEKTAAGGLAYGGITAKNCYNYGILRGPCQQWSEHTNYRWGIGRNECKRQWNSNKLHFWRRFSASYRDNLYIKWLYNI